MVNTNLNIAIMSPIGVIPISRRYSLFKSINISTCILFSTKIWAYVAAEGDGIPEALKNFTHCPKETHNISRRLL